MPVTDYRYSPALVDLHTLLYVQDTSERLRGFERWLTQWVQEAGCPIVISGQEAAGQPAAIRVRIEAAERQLAELVQDHSREVVIFSQDPYLSRDECRTTGRLFLLRVHRGP